ncbi:Golgi phosphoprotein 3 GPP34 [Stackebrandtia endophytica]|uniref:Golgi phosphoprotein 3 GPP34 n=1 Tax=Stackebrandtia endophytica TaxID=1496996 RepID=A0A543AVP9_9ACTN|nr:GPP34 family phosphoprotein [Stackebrandtia endophytica]TQL76611.1 Golgi phosphoprotein 3 GPP34 [Stackebrandtia endophytica]
MTRQLLLADELLLVAVNPRTGRLTVSPRLMGFGLGAAVLGELILDGYLSVSPTGMVEWLPQMSDRHPRDPLGYKVAHQVATEARSRPLEQWLRVLSLNDIRRDVGQRMVQSGLISPPARTGISRQYAYRTVAAADQWWWWQRIRDFLTLPGRELPEIGDLCLLGIADAIGLRPSLLRDTPAEAVRILDGTREMPGPPGHLIRHTHVLTASQALS